MLFSIQDRMDSEKASLLVVILWHRRGTVIVEVHSIDKTVRDAKDFAEAYGDWEG